MTLTVFFQFLVPFLSAVFVEEMKQCAFLFIFSFFFFASFTLTLIYARSPVQCFFFFFPCSASHVNSNYLMIPKD